MSVGSWTKANNADCRGVTLESANELAIAYLPDPHAFVYGSGSEQFAVSTESYRVHFIAVPGERPYNASVFEVRNIDCLIEACGGNSFPIWTESDGGNAVSMMIKNAKHSARVGVPQ